MSSEERQQILKMLEEGKITAEQALTLIKELEADTDEAQASEKAGIVQADAGFAAGSRIAGGDAADLPPSFSTAPDLEQTAEQARSLWRIPLYIGLGVTVLTAWGIYWNMTHSGFNFWFFCLWFPFLLGVGLMALAAWSRGARWLFVNVDRSRSSGGGPRRIFLGFPLPLDLAAWFMRTFGRRIEGLWNTNVDEIIQAISIANSMDEPLIVNVDDSKDGERVQVFIG